MTSTSIRDMPADQRPRERFSLVGPRRLKDAEVLALIIGSGVAGRSSLELAQSLLKAFGGPVGLSAASIHELQKADGVGEALAARIAAASELSRRCRLRAPKNDGG